MDKGGRQDFIIRHVNDMKGVDRETRSDSYLKRLEQRNVTIA
jgi:hypothetical protein